MKKAIFSLATLLLIIACKTETSDNIEVVEEPLESVEKSTNALKEELLIDNVVTS